jgi:cystathionine gamma-synthase/methionine-gamma-lyase
MTEKPALDFSTIAAQAASRIRVGDTISTAPPIDPSTTFTYESVEAVHEALAPAGGGFAYARNANPTVVALEETIAALEGAEEAVAFGSGMAAIHAALLSSGLRTGDTVLASGDLYGVTLALLRQLEPLGIHVVYCNVRDLGELACALEGRRPRVLFFESISNPLLKVADIAAVADLGREHGATVILDNTFATPVLVRPLAVSVDIVVHSATKYIAGHGDVMAGVLAGSRDRTRAARDHRTAVGGILSPFEAWLTIRGIRTLPLRVARQCESAHEIATWLQGRPWVERVYYPGLPHHPDHEIATRQFAGMFGGMIAFDVAAGRQETVRFIDALRLITPGTSLGDVESLVLYPPLTSHRTLDSAGLRAAGIGDGLVRMSVGLESQRDLIADLEQAARQTVGEWVAAGRRSSAQ